jgi:hypothetical protein
VPLAIANAVQWFRRARSVNRDLTAGKVAICEGESGEFAVAAPVAKRLVRLGVTIANDSPLKLEVLPKSASIWTVNGRRVGELVALPRGATSTTPEFATVAAKWTKPLETLRGLIQYNRRSLSDSEKEELRFYLPNLSRRLLWLIALHLLLAYQLVRFARGDYAYGMMAFLSAAIAMLANRKMLRVVQFHRKLRRDLSEGWVIIVRPTNDPEDEKTPAVEYLPVTGAEWTSAGHPATWRKMYGRFSGSPATQ